MVDLYCDTFWSTVLFEAVMKIALQLVSSLVWTWAAVFSVLVASMWKLPCATMGCLLHIHMPSGKASFFR